MGVKNVGKWENMGLKRFYPAGTIFLSGYFQKCPSHQYYCSYNCGKVILDENGEIENDLSWYEIG